MKTRLPILLWCSLLVLSGIAQQPAIELLRSYRQALPFEKLYLHTDQSVYEPGELIWFSAYLVNDQNQRVNDWIEVQLLDPQYQVVTTVDFAVQPEKLSACIPLSASLGGGVYTLRATTQWLFNFGKDAFFEKKLLIQKTTLPRLRLKLELDRNKYQAEERVVAQVEALSNDNQALANIELKATPILGNTTLPPITARTNAEGKATIVFQLPAQVSNRDGLLQVQVQYEGQTESIARSIPLRQEQIKLWLLPEGGDLVAGFKQKVAFKMLDSLGNSIDGQGSVYNSQHQPLANFASFHKGMGTFDFTPQLGTRYYARVEGQKDTFFLPQARADELALRVALPTKDSLPLYVWKRSPGYAHLLLRSKDSIVWQQKLQLPTGGQALAIPIASLPIGIAEIVLLDEQGRPFAERLVFLNHHRKAQVQIKTQQESYLPNENIQLEIEAKDETGQALDGTFSLAVVDDLHWTTADDKQDNILSRLLLSAELKGKIDEPAFYFRPDEPKIPAALDLLMLTHGWRKFSWKEIRNISTLNSTDSLVAFPHNRMLKGELMHNRKWKDNIHGKVWIEGQEKVFETDSRGRFALELPTDLAKYPLTVMGRFRGMEAQQNLHVPLIANIEWPTSQKTALKTINVNAIVQPEQKGNVSLLQRKEMGFIDFTDFSGRSAGMNELVVAGYSSIGLAANVASAVSSAGGGPGIGDNLVMRPGDFYHQSNLYIQFDDAPRLYEKYFNVRRQDRVFADFIQINEYNQDYRDKTIFWASTINLKQGKASLRFPHTTKTGTFRIILEGTTDQGLLGRSEATYAVQKRLELSGHVPQFASSGDTIILEARLKNRSEASLQGTLVWTLNGALQCLDETQLEQKINIPPDTFLLRRVACVVQRNVDLALLDLRWRDEANLEYWRQNFKVQARGIPHSLTHAGADARSVFRFPLSSLIPGSLVANFHAYSSVYQEMVEGLDAIIREPHGCFEQVSSSNYPSIMALRVLQESGGIDFDFQRKALAHLRKGYKLLTRYEVRGGGFSVFGDAPASERLTAYGLLQFWDMRSVLPEVDMQMFQKNLDWLLSRKKAYAGRYADDLLSHLFTLYALSEFRPDLLQDDLADFEKKEQKVLAQNPYLLSMLLSAAANVRDSNRVERLQRQLKHVLEEQKPGAFQVEQTFSLSYGKNVQTETAAWAILALCKAGQDQDAQVKNLLAFLTRSRTNNGGFGSTQATVVALKTLQAYQQKADKQQAPGKIQVRVNQTWLDTLHYEPGQLQKLNLECSQWLQAGNNEIEIVQTSKQKPIPFLFEANWASTEFPRAQHPQPLTLDIQYNHNQVQAGDFVRLSVKLKNQLSRPVNAPMLVLGIPAGLSLQSWQLLEMEKKHLFDHFEIQDDYIVLYFESLDSQSERDFYFDLKASQSGFYHSPLSTAYPYYDAEQKTWAEALPIRIHPSNTK